MLIRPSIVGAGVAAATASALRLLKEFIVRDPKLLFETVVLNVLINRL